MPPSKKTFRDQAAILNGRLASPQKAIKCVAAIALSPVKARPQKKHRNNDPEDHELATSESIQEPGPSAANKENADVFLEDSDPVAQYQGEFHQGSTPETPTAAPMAFTLKGKLFTAKNPANQSPLQDDDRASTHTFPISRPPSMLAESDNDNDLDSETVPPELDELCAVDAGAFAGDGYPRPAPPKTFIEKMAALGTKKALAAAPDITSAKAALMDIELVLRGPSRGKGGGYTPPDLSPWVRVRMEGIRSHLAQYTNPNSVTYRKWGISARQAAIAAGRDVYSTTEMPSRAHGRSLTTRRGRTKGRHESKVISTGRGGGPAHRSNITQTERGDGIEYSEDICNVGQEVPTKRQDWRTVEFAPSPATQPQSSTGAHRGDSARVSPPVRSALSAADALEIPRWGMARLGACARQRRLSVHDGLHSAGSTTHSGASVRSRGSATTRRMRRYSRRTARVVSSPAWQAREPESMATRRSTAAPESLAFGGPFSRVDERKCGRRARERACAGSSPADSVIRRAPSMPRGCRARERWRRPDPASVHAFLPTCSRPRGRINPPSASDSGAPVPVSSCPKSPSTLIHDPPSSSFDSFSHSILYRILSLRRRLMANTITLTSPNVEDDIEEEASDSFNLAHDLLQEYKAAANVSNLNSAIYLLRRAAHCWLPAQPELPECLNNLASALLTRFSYTAELEDVQMALAFRRGAAGVDVRGLFPGTDLSDSEVEDDPWNMASCALTILADFHQSVDGALLDSAIFLHRQALSLWMPLHPRRWKSLFELSSCLIIRFGLTGEIAELHEAVSILRQLQLLQPNRSSCLYAALITGNQKMIGPSQIREAAELGKKAMTSDAEALELGQSSTSLEICRTSTLQFLN
ncbi:hypothetical protein B0H10DRAFT_2184301 [Mycena sp. CBHHK59/15]|nr:hypothetical protein B0H10DRAFT_2184301 [Mycena sp. CBHHK59/15]